MRRLKILFFWLFKKRNNVSFSELIRFLLKSKARNIAERYIDRIELRGDDYEVSYKGIARRLYWPASYSLDGVYQVTAETFDSNDWHYYQKSQTEVAEGEVILDIGTAEGLFILNVVDKCRKAILVEPNALFGKALERTFSNDRDKVTIHNVAVGDAQNVISFNSNSLSGKIDSVQEGTTKMETIDALMSDERVITYLKADIEGFELKMLKGAGKTIRRCRPKIVITSYHDENNASELIDLIRGYVPEYKYYVKGIFQRGGKPVMIHFWLEP